MSVRFPDGSDWRTQALAEFDPNAQPDRHWAVYNPTIKPVFKTYKRRQDALMVTRWAHYANLYHWEDGRWVEVLRKDLDAATHCDICGVEIATREWSYQRPDFTWKREMGTGRIAEPLTLITHCFDCAP